MASNPVVITFDPDELTLDELIAWEDITGHPIGAFDPRNVSARDMLAMVYINGKRADATYTLDDARAVRVADIDASALLGKADRSSLAPLATANGRAARASKRSR